MSQPEAMELEYSSDERDRVSGQVLRKAHPPRPSDGEQGVIAHLREMLLAGMVLAGGFVGHVSYLLLAVPRNVCCLMCGKRQAISPSLASRRHVIIALSLFLSLWVIDECSPLISPPLKCILSSFIFIGRPC